LARPERCSRELGPIVWAGTTTHGIGLPGWRAPVRLAVRFLAREQHLYSHTHASPVRNLWRVRQGASVPFGTQTGLNVSMLQARPTARATLIRLLHQQLCAASAAHAAAACGWEPSESQIELLGLRAPVLPVFPLGHRQHTGYTRAPSPAPCSLQSVLCVRIHTQHVGNSYRNMQ
jgi:hypothetical protein